MPQFFYPPPKGEIENIEVDPARQREVATWIAAYIWQNGVDENPKPYGSYPGGGDPVLGREVIKEVGCLACHQIDDGMGGRLGVLNATRLDDIGAKVASPDWIWNWIREPTWHNEYTRMPSLRLSGIEARHVTAYLWQSAKDAPAENAEVREQLEDPELAKKGEAMMALVGCTGCHVIPGQEQAGRVGAELTLFGEKTTDLLAFGDSTIPHTWEDWTRGKLANPRQYIDERSQARMPNFHLEEEEINALVMFLRSLRRPLVPEEMKRNYSGGHYAKIARGQALVEHYNCVGCHQIEGRGGDVLYKVVDRMPDDVQASGALAPPNLKGEGIKIQADYLNKFLRNPTPIRPWVKTRMPTFNLSDTEISEIIAYFRSLEDIEDPYDTLELTAATPQSIARGRQLFETYQCRNCHLWQGRVPAGELGPRNGPDLSVLDERMRPEGVAAWIRDPQRMMPGTAMPGFFYSANADCEMLVPNTFRGDCETDKEALQEAINETERQINDIVNYLYAGPHAQPGLATR
jgi:cytochrome c2